MYCLPPALTTTVHLFFDAPGERARRTALQTHAPPELRGAVPVFVQPLVDVYTLTPFALLGIDNLRDDKKVHVHLYLLVRRGLV